MNKLLNAMDADLTTFSRQLGQVKKARRGLNEVAEEIATGGRGTGRTRRKRMRRPRRQRSRRRRSRSHIPSTTS